MPKENKSKPHKILGFDFGMKYIGVAVGQSITNTAEPLQSLNAIDGIPDWEEIQKLITHWQPTDLVVGIPLNLDGTKQDITFCAEKFANRLKEKFKLPLYKVDETLSTWEAKKNLKIPYKGQALNKKQLDKVNAMAASILIEQWLRDNLAG